MCSYSFSFIEGIEVGKIYMQDKKPQTNKADRLVYRIPLAAGSRSEGRGAGDKSSNIGIVMVGACRA